MNRLQRWILESTCTHCWHGNQHCPKCGDPLRICCHCGRYGGLIFDNYQHKCYVAPPMRLHGPYVK